MCVHKCVHVLLLSWESELDASGGLGPDLSLKAVPALRS